MVEVHKCLKCHFCVCVFARQLVCKRICHQFKQACLVIETLPTRHLLNIWKSLQSGCKIRLHISVFLASLWLTLESLLLQLVTSSCMRVTVNMSFEVAQLCLRWHYYFWYTWVCNLVNVCAFNVQSNYVYYDKYSWPCDLPFLSLQCGPMKIYLK